MNPFRFDVAFNYTLQLLPYLKITFTYTIWSILISVILGLPVAAAKVGKNKILRGLAVGYTAALRAIPSIVLIFLVYYGIPPLVKLFFSTDITRADRIIFVIIAMSLFGIASMSEVMKSAYQSVSRGQYEAAVSNGMSGLQAIRRIVFPQAFLISIPHLGNTVSHLVKEGALAYTIGVVDIMARASVLNTKSYGNDFFEIYFVLAGIYWILTIAFDKGFFYLEKKLSLASTLNRQEGKAS